MSRFIDASQFQHQILDQSLKDLLRNTIVSFAISMPTGRRGSHAPPRPPVLLPAHTVREARTDRVSTGSRVGAGRHPRPAYGRRNEMMAVALVEGRPAQWPPGSVSGDTDAGLRRPR